MELKNCLERLSQISTPYYLYDTRLLCKTLTAIRHGLLDNETVHYAIKANSNPKLLRIIKDHGLGADCVSGGEISIALKAGFAPEKIVFAGVGKSDDEINYALDNGISCFNVESIQELEVIDELAKHKNRIADIALRINPNIDAHTHSNITTGLEDNKFGMSLAEIQPALQCVAKSCHLKLIGLHFHIGSQIRDLSCYVDLCSCINRVLADMENQGLEVNHINVGGGLGIDYDSPENEPIPDFDSYFNVFRKHLHFKARHTIHYELGRSIVGQCGYLITKVLYVKERGNKNFAIVDAGMTDLIRPALYGARHKIESLSKRPATKGYDVVGPICESSDIFGTDIMLNEVSRNDYIIIHSAGAYGEAMASGYNGRRLPVGYTTDDLNL